MKYRNLFPAITLFLLFSLGEKSFGQYNSQGDAAAILEKFSQKALSEEGFSVIFDFSSEEPILNKSDSWQGSLWLKKDKYKVITSSLILFSDGIKRWQYLPEVNEVNVQLCSHIAPEEDDFMISNPIIFFSLYEKQFIASKLGQTTLRQRKVEEIDLIPRSHKGEISRVKLWIDSVTFELVSAKVIQKSGIQYVLVFRNYRWGDALPEKEYQFDPSLYPGVEIIEMDL